MTPKLRLTLDEPFGALDAPDSPWPPREKGLMEDLRRKSHPAVMVTHAMSMGGNFAFIQIGRSHRHQSTPNPRRFRDF
jgi:ABC-type nitrate/sulfonate/bicarbonate transport system ATPase subunit